MTAALQTWGGDAMPDGVAILPADASSYFMTRARAEQLLQRGRACRDQAVAGITGFLAVLAEARAGNAHAVLGLTWHELVAQMWGDLRDLRLNGSPEARDERRQLVASMTDAGMTIDEIQPRLDYSRGTIQADRVATGRSAAGNRVLELVPDPDPYAGLSRTAETLARVAAQGSRGLTSIELDHETGWPMGTATGTLSKLARRDLIALTDVRRGNRGAYVLTDAGASALQ